MRSVLVTIIVTAAITAFADNLKDLKVASVRYVAAMKAVLAISDDPDCPELVAKANDYAAENFCVAWEAHGKALVATYQFN